MSAWPQCARNERREIEAQLRCNNQTRIDRRFAALKAKAARRW